MENLKSSASSKMVALILFAVIILTFQFGTVLADNISSSETVLKSSETLDRTGFFSGDNIDIAGTVNGTTFVAGSNVDISGVINGDLLVVGQNVTISGTVKGNIMSAGQDVSIDGNIENNIYSVATNQTIKSENKGTTFLAGTKMTIDKQAKIAKDLFAAGTQIFQNGEVGRNFDASADNISIGGSVGKNVKVSATDLYVQSGEINGSLTYDSTNKATISNDSKIAGKTDWNKVEPEPETSRLSLAVLFGVFISIVNLLIVWILIKLIRPYFWNNIARNIGENQLKSLGFGALALIVIPTAIFFLLISVFIYPLAIILALLFGIAIYVSKIIVAVFIGSMLEKKFNWKHRHKGVWTTLLGLVILSALGLIPVVGVIVNLAIILLGLGSIVLYIINGARSQQI